MSVQFEMFAVDRPTPEQIAERALSYGPVARFALFSGGDDSLTTTDWCVENVPDCEVLHIVTGIGIKKTRDYVQDVSRAKGWRLTILRAKEDCGQDYEKLVLEHGFPGPAHHRKMYARLKERCIELIVRQRKVRRLDKVMLATGIRHDESAVRAGYGGREINFRGAQMWVNPMYWVSASDQHHYRVQRCLPRNPVSKLLGMSGECLCGAFAEPGEKDMIRFIEPETADYLANLEARVRAAGHGWGWGERPPAPIDDTRTIDMFSPLCVSCLKSERSPA